eukprot:Rhum_TRINITY_DN14942_c7_g3::Rhum_TRINITY_DN14942_c7_g3_i1::g.126745::m.126745
MHEWTFLPPLPPPRPPLTHTSKSAPSTGVPEQKACPSTSSTDGPPCSSSAAAPSSEAHCHDTAAAPAPTSNVERPSYVSSADVPATAAAAATPTPATASSTSSTPKTPSHPDLLSDTRHRQCDRRDDDASAPSITSSTSRPGTASTLSSAARLCAPNTHLYARSTVRSNEAALPLSLNPSTTTVRPPPQPPPPPPPPSGDGEKRRRCARTASRRDAGTSRAAGASAAPSCVQTPVAPSVVTPSLLARPRRRCTSTGTSSRAACALSGRQAVTPQTWRCHAEAAVARPSAAATAAPFSETLIFALPPSSGAWSRPSLTTRGEQQE